MEKPERILIFELNWLGDILFSFPFIRAVRKVFPDAYIACTVVPRYVDLLANNPWINDVHALSDENSIARIGEKMAFIRMIRKERYDACFLLKPSRTKAVMAALAGIRERIGFAGKESPLTEAVDMPTDHIHRADQILALAGVAGVTNADGSYEYFVSEEDTERAELILHNAGGGLRRIVTINPGGNWEVKKWPVENFIVLAKKLLARFSDLEVMVTGAKKDKEVANRIVTEVGDKRCYSVAGKTGLNELAVLFKKSELGISADSGPLHLASAMGVTTIGLFCPTSPEITGPRGKGKNIVIIGETSCEVPCYTEDCPDCKEGMRSISPGMVADTAAQVLTKELYEE